MATSYTKQVLVFHCFRPALIDRSEVGDSGNTVIVCKVVFGENQKVSIIKMVEVVEKERDRQRDRERDIDIDRDRMCINCTILIVYCNILKIKKEQQETP